MRKVLERYATYLNCRILSFLFVYLGTPIGDNPRKKEMWDPIIAKFKKRLASWKHKHLSFAGSICLIKSIVTSLPLFYLSFFKVLLGVARI